MAITQEQKTFIERVGKLAAADMLKSRVLASLTIAQAILESGWGKSGLTVKANALFGIKAGSSWKGKVYSAKTQECYDGVNFTTITDTFRGYDSWEESVCDHSALLTGLARYKAVIGETDYAKACTAIRAAGYATDPAYTGKLINIIESYALTAYDGAGGKGEQKMTEAQVRANVLAIAQGFAGCKESDGSHQKIIDIYNSHKPLARGYPMNYKDAWCACFVTVVGIQAGYTDIIPKECGCGKMIDLFKRLGRWQESDAHTPKPGDVIFYDWEDSGSGDNAGASDHVGIVVSVTGGTSKVIEGNMSNAVGYRNIAVNGKYIRGYGLPDYAKKATGAATPPAGQPQPPSGSNNTGGALAFATGDVVRFAGACHFTSAQAAVGKGCLPGTAKVTQIAKGTKHPYHLVRESGGGSTVHGWVNAEDVSAVSGGAVTPKMRVGARVQYSGALYRDSNGNGQGKSVNGTYTVKYYQAGKKCGVHIDALGWVPESACKVIG